MGIKFSSHNAPDGNHGRKDHMVWLHRFDGSARALGAVTFTTYRKWCAELDNLKGGQRFFEADTLAQLRTQVRTAYNHFI